MATTVPGVGLLESDENMRRTTDGVVPIRCAKSAFGHAAVFALGVYLLQDVASRDALILRTFVAGRPTWGGEGGCADLVPAILGSWFCHGGPSELPVKLRDLYVTKHRGGCIGKTSGD
jgi:hypothetical protein